MATPSASDRRSVILKAAARLIEHYGHGKTTIADVAREAGVGVGTVYLEFASKEAIVQELSLAAHVGVLEAMRAAVKAHEDCARQLTAALEARTRAFVELQERGEHACELVHCKADSVRSAHERFKEQEQVILEVILQRGQSAGTFAPSEPTATAALIQRAFASLSPPWIFACADDAAKATVDLCHLLLHGLLSEKDPRAFVRPSPQPRGGQAKKNEREKFSPKTHRKS